MTKRKQPPRGKGNRQQNTAKNSTKESVKLNDNQLSQILNYYAQYHPNANQARRLIAALARKPDSPTNQLNGKGGVNLSHVAKINNPRLKKFGYFIRCILPSVPIKNSYGDAVCNLLSLLILLAGKR